MHKKNNFDFLKKIQHRTVSIENETVKLFRLGIFGNQTTWELVGFTTGLYRPHIHDNTGSLFRFVYGKGFILIENKKIPYSSGTTISVVAGQSHGFEIQEPTLVLSIQDRAILDTKTGVIDFRFAE